MVSDVNRRAGLALRQPAKGRIHTQNCTDCDRYPLSRTRYRLGASDFDFWEESCHIIIRRRKEAEGAAAVRQTKLEAK